MKGGKPMKIKDYLMKIFQLWRILLPILVILIILAIALTYLIHLFAYNQDDAVILEASGRTDIDFRVFYIENESFPNNPIPENLNFLMSFTDFIEMDSGLFARFSEEVKINYSYVATKRLVVRYRGSLISGEVNPIVFELLYPLSDISDSLIGQELSLPISTYIIFPEQYVETYLNFVSEQRRKINNTNRNPANFFAELSIEFIYDINIPTWGINEHIIRGYHLPLSTEVYSISSFGNSTFNQSLDLSTQSPRQTTLPMIMIFVVTFTISIYFLFTGIKNLKKEPNLFHREVLEISKRYSNEIVDSNMSLLSLFSSEQSQYILMRISKFESLLNLAINSNEHIMSYQDDNRAEFVVVKGEFAYYYEILNKKDQVQKT